MFSQIFSVSIDEKFTTKKPKEILPYFWNALILGFSIYGTKKEQFSSGLLSLVQLFETGLKKMHYPLNLAHIG